MDRYIGVDRLISLIYDTAIDTEKWPELLDALAQFIHHSPVITPPTLDSDETAPMLAPGEGGSIAAALQSLGEPGSLAVSGRALVPNEQEAVNQILLEHFSRALQIAKSLLHAEEQRETIHSVLNQLPIALLLVDAEGRLLGTLSL